MSVGAADKNGVHPVTRMKVCVNTVTATPIMIIRRVVTRCFRFRISQLNLGRDIIMKTKPAIVIPANRFPMNAISGNAVYHVPIMNPMAIPAAPSVKLTSSRYVVMMGHPDFLNRHTPSMRRITARAAAHPYVKSHHVFRIVRPSSPSNLQNW